jgi:ribonuclease HII
VYPGGTQVAPTVSAESGSPLPPYVESDLSGGQGVSAWQDVSNVPCQKSKTEEDTAQHSRSDNKPSRKHKVILVEFPLVIVSRHLTMQLRRSARLLALSSSSSSSSSSHCNQNGKAITTVAMTAHTGFSPSNLKMRQPSPKTKEVGGKRRRSVSSSSTTTSDHPSKQNLSVLSRTREKALLLTSSSTNSTTTTDATMIHFVFGVDEAGRGPLAGPVVAAAAWVPTDVPGVMDSKLIIKEEERERLFHILTTPSSTQDSGSTSATSCCTWTCAVVDAPTIDEINILQASLLAMKMASDALVQLLVLPTTSSNVPEHTALTSSLLSSKPSAKRTGCYVFGGQAQNYVTTTTTTGSEYPSPLVADSSSNLYALLDGNHVPKNMPCAAESIIKGDSKEYCIAAASIIAKVTRDRLMREYDEIFQVYNFAKHKGYPTKEHIETIYKYGPSSIHRRTFQPIKGMLLSKGHDDNTDNNNIKTT